MHLKLLALTLLISSSLLSQAQPGPRAGQAGGRPAGGGGPPQLRFGGSMAKLFGDNSAFTADLLMEMKTESSTMSIPGKISFLDGKSRFEMDATKMTGGELPPEAAAQMKQMGMAEMVTITLPEKNETYIIYPGLKAYAALPAQPGQENATADKTDLQKTELGKETIEGHATTKNKVVLKDDQGNEQEATVWNASDLKDFPVRIQTVTEGVPSTVTFKNVELTKPEESLFTPPADYQKYNDVGTMMRESMMKRLAPNGGLPPKK